MTILDSFREMLAQVHKADGLPAEVEVRLPRPSVRAMIRDARAMDAGGTLVATGPEETYPWLRLYEPWGCLFIRPLEEK